MIKGHTSQQRLSKQEYVSVQPVGAGAFANNVAPKYYFSLGTDAVEAGSTQDQIVATAHGLREGDMIRFAALTTHEHVEASVIEIVDADNFKIGFKLSSAPSATEGFEAFRPVSQVISSSGAIAITEAAKTMVDELDAESIDPSVTTIPRATSNAISVVASLAASCSQIQVISDVGEFMAIYEDAARTTKICNLPLTPDEKVDVAISAGTTIYLGAIKDVDITAASLLLINFIG